MSEAYQKGKGKIADVSWRDMLAQDPYFGLTNSFQYSENINCDDEMHGIKLSQRIMVKNEGANCQLISAGDPNGTGGRVFLVPVSTENSAVKVKYFDIDTHPNTTDNLDLSRFPGGTIQNTALEIPAGCTTGEAVIFQDYLWVPISNATENESYFKKVNIANTSLVTTYSKIRDHIEDSDESISHISTLGVTTLTESMYKGINQVINFNNTRLVCGVGEDLWVFYPELDASDTNNTSLPHIQRDPSTQTMRAVLKGETGWKKVQRFEAGCQIMGLTCDFQYLKVWVQDEGWNTKMYYYPGNNDLRNTFVYNIVDMTGTKVLRTYNINGIDYFTASLDGTDGYITFNKVIGDTPVQIFKQRGGLTRYDINQKAGYFVGPTTWNSEYHNGSFYVGDAYGVFKFAFDPTGYDTGYLKRKARSVAEVTVGLCIASNFLFISDESGLKAMRLYDTGVDGYEAKGILISREIEGDFGGCVAKIIDELRCHFEMNNIKKSNGSYRISDAHVGKIDIYLSPNNTWQSYDPTEDSTGRWHVMSLDGENRKTRYEMMSKFGQLPKSGGYTDPVFEYDRETITYCIVIRRGKDDAQWTPVVREIYMGYHTKGKTNDIYDIN